MLTIEQKNQISNAASNWMAEKGMTQADLAKKANINAATLSLILRQKYTYEVDGVDHEINIKWFNMLANTIGYSVNIVHWRPVKTAELTHVIHELTTAKSATRCITIIMQTGLGKTYSINRFCGVHPQHTFKVTVNHLHKVRDILNELAEQVGVPVSRYPIETLINISNRLKQLRMMGYKPIVIIDEAENLKLSVVQMLKGLYDRMESYASLVLIGTPQLLRILERMRTNDQPGAPQFYRRIKAGIKQIPVYNNYVLFFEEFKIEDKGLRSLIMKLVTNYGELHDYLEPVLREAYEKEVPVTEELFRLVHNIPKI